MLLLGTVLSLVTAVAATRAMLGLLAGFRWFDNPRVHGRARGQTIAKWQQIDVNSPKRRRLFLVDRDRGDRRQRRRRSASRA